MKSSGKRKIRTQGGAHRSCPCQWVFFPLDFFLPSPAEGKYGCTDNNQARRANTYSTHSRDAKDG